MHEIAAKNSAPAKYEKQARGKSRAELSRLSIPVRRLRRSGHIQSPHVYRSPLCKRYSSLFLSNFTFIYSFARTPNGRGIPSRDRAISLRGSSDARDFTSGTAKKRAPIAPTTAAQGPSSPVAIVSYTLLPYSTADSLSADLAEKGDGSISSATFGPYFAAV